MAKLIVCGGRHGNMGLTRNRVWAVLDARAEDYAGQSITVVHGGAIKTDTWAGAWARRRGYEEIAVRINEDLDGFKDHEAPKNRNQRMYAAHKDADECVGFPGRGGTLDMMTRCHKGGMPVADIDLLPDGSWRLTWWPQT